MIVGFDNAGLRCAIVGIDIDGFRSAIVIGNQDTCGLRSIFIESTGASRCGIVVTDTGGFD